MEKMKIHDDYLMAYCEGYPNNKSPRVAYEMYCNEEETEWYISSREEEDYEEGSYLLSKMGKEVIRESFSASSREEANERFSAFLAKQNVSKIYKKIGTFEF